MSMPASYKPSPLGYGSHGSQRGSPFRRPESPVSPSPLRQSTPTAAGLKSPGGTSRSRFAQSSDSTPTADRWTPRAGTSSLVETRSAAPPTKSTSHSNALSQLQPAQVRMLRDGFQILDRDSDGVVNRDDIADMLNQLGLPSNATEVSQFFPPSAPQTMSLAVFVNSLSTTLAALSPSSELLSAFSAFDDDDSGQVDLAELRDALLHTAPEPGDRPLSAMEVDKVINGFTGRRAFSKSKQGGLAKRGEVFKYQDFVGSIVGGGNGASEQGSEDSEES
ncbi:EF-hand [Thozetella sp. PMI_491]|nr:EF-hand [Thozetella sp. PMI_491]